MSHKAGTALSSTTLQASEVALTQEVRFAVVMYGGISLATYMNGVAQEMLKLVRATAPAQDGSRANLREPTGSELVYRKLGQLLNRDSDGSDGLDPEVKKLIFSGETIPLTKYPLKTRCVIDILSGSSAGGLNAIFLAKALANDQRLDELKRLWIDKADVKVLLNDKQSTAGLGLKLDDPPRSLFNGNRIYSELLSALRGMDVNCAVQNSTIRSALVDELDLYVTATDLRGLPIRFKLGDRVASEWRHRNVFHFSYRNEKYNDFGHENNAFLAFAARCTSAHPAAFEAMRLEDIEPVAKRDRPSGEKRYDDPDLHRFYADYLRDANGESDTDLDVAVKRFQKRCFNDGAVLDNKPFTYAIEQIPMRSAALPVDRKLLYLEPGPENAFFDDPNESEDRLNFIENARLSLSSLPRYESISADLARLLERNRLVERLNRILSGLDRDEQQRKMSGQPGASLSQTSIWAAESSSGEYLDQLIAKYGKAWANYHRLRVAVATDDLALLMGFAVGLDAESDELSTLRDVVRVWRSQRYDAYRDSETPRSKDSEQVFLNQFDLQWAIRRLRFTLAHIDEVTRPAYRAAQPSTGDGSVRNGTRELAKACAMKQAPEAIGQLDEGKLQQELRDLKKKLNGVLDRLRDLRRDWWAPNYTNRENSRHPLHQEAAALGFKANDLRDLREPRPPGAAAQTGAATGEAYERRLEDFVRKLGQNPSFNELTAKIARAILDPIREAFGECKSILSAGADDSPHRQQARLLVRQYYERFPEYDQIAFPLLYSTGVGEEIDQIEVFRISPVDATSIVDEWKLKRRKLMGTTLSRFGGFFEEKFRSNDILWGQLDGAERLITALLPGQAHRGVRDQLIAEAHHSLIGEHLSSVENPNLSAKAVESLISLAPDGSLRASLLARLGQSDLRDLERDQLRALLDQGELRARFIKDFKDQYEKARRFTPEDTVRAAARAGHVFGNMLEGVAGAYGQAENRVLMSVIGLLRWFWGIVEISIPGELPYQIRNYWMKLLYLFETFLIVFGVALGMLRLSIATPLWQSGLLLLGASLIVHAIFRWIGELMRTGRLSRTSRLVLTMFALAVIGLLFLPDSALEWMIRALTWWQANNM